MGPLSASSQAVLSRLPSPAGLLGAVGTRDRKEENDDRQDQTNGEGALAKVLGATIQRVENDADGHAAYEAHMQRSDGSLVTVYVNEQFEVVSVENGR